MNKNYTSKLKGFSLVITASILLSAIPYFAGSGLTTVQPIGAFLNGNFPADISSGNDIPGLLSETGAFNNVLTLDPSPGMIPYDLIEPFWSDGAEKRRWMVVPNDGSYNTSSEQITYSLDNPWDFPIGSILVKHFEMPVDERNPEITKRLETRFSVKSTNGSFY